MKQVIICNVSESVCIYVRTTQVWSLPVFLITMLFNNYLQVTKKDITYTVI